MENQQLNWGNTNETPPNPWNTSYSNNPISQEENQQLNWADTSETISNPWSNPSSWDQPSDQSNPPSSQKEEENNQPIFSSPSTPPSPPLDTQIETSISYLGNFNRLNIENSIYFIQPRGSLDKEISNILESSSPTINGLYDINPNQNDGLGIIIKDIVDIGKSRNLKISDLKLGVLNPSQDIKSLFTTPSTNYFIYFLPNNTPSQVEIIYDLSKINGPILPILKTIPNIFSILPGYGNYRITNDGNSKTYLIGSFERP